MFVAVDIGGTNARVATYHQADPYSMVSRHQFKITGDFHQDLYELVTLIVTVLDGTAPTGIGLGIAGALDEERSRVVAAGNLAHWVGQPFKTELEQRFEVPVTVGNDAYVNVLAELVFAEAPDDVLGITWGSGVGGCFGRTAAEPGHVIVDPQADNPECGCGRRGCLESFAGGAKIEQKWGLTHAGEMNEEQLTEVVEAMAQGLASILCAHPAPTVIFAGGVATKQPGWIDRIHARTAEVYGMGAMPEFRPATYGEDTGLAGALALLADQ